MRRLLDRDRRRDVRLIPAWFVGVIVSVWAPTPGWSYSVDNHEIITRAAVALVNSCHQVIQSIPEVPARYVEILVKYNTDQDGVLRKARLWHFPADPGVKRRRSAAPWPAPWLVTVTTQDCWVRHLLELVRQDDSPGVVYPALGALLHYVQDQAVPAHAAGVFHPYRFIPIQRDSVDEWDTSAAASQFPSTSESMVDLCRTLAEPRDVTEIMDEVQRDTLLCFARNTSTAPSPNECPTPAEGLSWSVFWSPWAPARDGTLAQPEDDPGFGRYSCDGRDVFGKKQFDCGSESYEIRDGFYDEFIRHQTVLAIKASASAIIQLHGRAGPCAKDTCEPRSDDFLPSKSILCTIKGCTEVYGCE